MEVIVKNMETIDKSNMRGVILDSPRQLIKGLELAKNIHIEAHFENVVICGIGGSALPVNVLNTIVKPNIPVLTHRNYNLPNEATEKSLVVCISYSGNTEETVSALEQSIEKKIKTIGIATGGKIEKICNEHNIPFVKIPSGIEPRSATGYLFSALAKILANAKIIQDPSVDVINSVKDLESVNESLEKEGKEFAKKLKGKIPVVYASAEFKNIARIWKIKFNENSKTPAFWNYFPELNHNEMVGFSQLEKKNNFHFIIIKDNYTHERNLKRMDLFGDLLKEKGSGVSFVDFQKGSLLSGVFAMLLLGDWVSYYLALENKVDPTPVKMVEDFKKLMEK